MLEDLDSRLTATPLSPYDTFDPNRSERTTMRIGYFQTLLRRALFVIGATFLISAAEGRAAPPTEAAAVELKVIKYDALLEIVRALKGRVVVVDFWAEY